MALRCSLLALVAILPGFTAIEVSHATSHADFLTSSERLVSGDIRCTFDAFLNNEHRPIAASTGNIMFESDGVLVVQEHSARIMVFLTKGTIFNWWAPSCGQQAVVECDAKSTQMTAKHGMVSEVACGSYQVCAPRAEPDLSYMRSMIGGALVERKGKLGRIASIGLGAGSIPLWLHQMIPAAQVEAVDISEAVIEAAPCFGLPLSAPNLKLIHADGVKYLSSQADGSCDILFVDVFVEQDDAIPPSFKTVEFFNMVKTKLAPGGILAMNIGDLRSEVTAITGSLKQAFSSSSGVWIGEAPGLTNTVVLARAPGGSEVEHAATTGENAAGLSAAKLWAAQARFRSSLYMNGLLQATLHLNMTGIYLPK